MTIWSFLTEVLAELLASKQYCTSGLLHEALFSSTSAVQWCFWQQWVAKEDGWVQKQSIYGSRNGGKAVFEILVPNPAFPKAATQKEQPWWNHSVALWAEAHWLWPFCHHSLNNTHPDNKAASMPQLLSSKPALLQVQSAALPSQYLLSFPLQMGFVQHHTRDTKRASVFTCVGWGSDETVQILTHYSCLQLTLATLSVEKIGQMKKKGLILKSSKQEVWNILTDKLIVNNTIFIIQYLKKTKNNVLTADFPRY